MKRLFFGLVLLIFSFQAQAQDLVYLNAYEYPVKDISTHSYSYVRVTTRNGNAIQTQTFNLDTIKVVHSTILLDDKGNETSKRVLRYYEDGTMKSNIRENLAEKTVEEKHYYPSGKLKVEIEKKKGKVISQDYFDINGYPAKARGFKPASPKGGAKGWMQYLAKNLRYPVTSRNAGIEGTVIIGFEIDKKGQVLNPEVVNPENVAADLANDALRAVLDYPDLWSPELENGFPVKTKTKLPITFKTGM